VSRARSITRTAAIEERCRLQGNLYDDSGLPSRSGNLFAFSRLMEGSPWHESDLILRPLYQECNSGDWPVVKSANHSIMLAIIILRKRSNN
jgi:hypothetical protein